MARLRHHSSQLRPVRRRSKRRYTVLHTFHGGSADGARPTGKLILAGSTIYGITQNGGSQNFGTVYRMDVTGDNFAVLHSFVGGASDGELPGGAIVLVDSTLYGIAELGGPDNLGVVFKINTDSTGFGILHPFATGPGDGHLPLGGLTLAGSTLYGTTAQGGSKNNGGTIFKIDLAGTGYAILHEFSGTHGDGNNPEKDLTLSGNTLYSVTNQGGTAGTGTIFKIDTNGSGYGVIYSFEGATGNDGHPSSPVLVVGDHLIGTTDPIDNNIPALTYTVRVDGSDFNALYRFNGPTTEGREPGGNLVVMGQDLFGVTWTGGATGVNGGVMYSLPLPLKITSINGAVAGQFSLTGQTFPNSPVTIQILANLQSDPTGSYPTAADSSGTFHFEDVAAGTSPRFYRVTMP